VSAPTAPTAICLYRVRAGCEAEFKRLLERHWPTLHSLALVTDEPARHYRGFEKDGGPIFVEVFTWASEQATAHAHEHPEVMAVWEPMDKLTESRDGRPNMEFPHVRPLSLLDET
jgi:L-rhamnose mutarotase